MIRHHEHVDLSSKDMMLLAAQIARVMGYLIASEKLNIHWKDIAIEHSTEEVLGRDQWRAVAEFTIHELQEGVMVSIECDEKGPYLSLDEQLRVARLLLERWKLRG